MLVKISNQLTLKTFLLMKLIRLLKLLLLLKLILLTKLELSLLTLTLKTLTQKKRRRDATLMARPGGMTERGRNEMRTVAPARSTLRITPRQATPGGSRKGKN